MAQNSAQGSITLMKTREGSNFSVWLSSTKPLFQLYSVTDGQVTAAPDWTASGNAPIVTVNVSGGVQVRGVMWYIDDVLASIMNLSGEGISNNNLKINQNMANNGNRHSRTLKAVITLYDGKTEYRVTKTEVIRIQEAVGRGITVFIETPDGQNVDENNSVKLVGTLYEGINPIPDYSGYTLTFHRAGADKTSKALNNLNAGSDLERRTLEVNADMVDGATTFICRAYNSSGEELDAESVVIFDSSDQYRLRATVTPRQNTTQSETPQVNVTAASVGSQYDNAIVEFAVVNSQGVEKTDVSNWKVQKYHSETMRLIKNNGNSEANTSPTDTEDSFKEDTGAGNTANTNRIIVYDRDYLLAGVGSLPVHDTNVVVTAEVELKAPQS